MMTKLTKLINNALLLTTASAAGLMLFFALRQFTQPLGSGDAPIYQAMAEHPFKFTQAPHGYRIFVPWLAHAVMTLTNSSVSTAFLAVTSTLFAVVVAVLTGWARYIERVDGWLAVQFSLLFACSYAGIYNAHNYIHVGFGEYLILIAGFAAIRAERFGAVLALVAIGGLVKESTAVLVPIWFVYEAGTIAMAQLVRRTILLAATVLVVFAWLHVGLFPHAMAAHASVYTTHYFQELRNYWGSPYNVAMRISDTFGVLWPLAMAGFVYADARTRRLAVLIPLALAQIVVATDISRMTATALPAVLFFAMVFLRHLPRIVQMGLTLLTITVFITYNYGLPVTRWLLLAAYLTVPCVLGWIRLQTRLAIAREG